LLDAQCTRKYAVIGRNKHKKYRFRQVKKNRKQFRDGIVKRISYTEVFSIFTNHDGKPFYGTALLMTRESPSIFKIEGTQKTSSSCQVQCE